VFFALKESETFAKTNVSESGGWVEWGAVRVASKPYAVIAGPSHIIEVESLSHGEMKNEGENAGKPGRV
jgi:hypothetical protein